MTDITRAIYDKLVAEPTVAALLGNRIYLSEAPQNPVTPYATYFSVVPRRDRTAQGRSGLVRSRLQFDIYDSKVAKAGQTSVITITNTIRDAVDGFRGIVSGVRIRSLVVDGDQDATVPKARLAQRRVDMIVWHDDL